MDKRRMHQLLAIAEEHARTARARVRQQEERVRKLPAGSHQREISEKTLKNLRDLAETMEKHKDLISRNSQTIGQDKIRSRLAFDDSF